MKVVCVDTDSVKFTKPDGSPFTEEEHDEFYKYFSEQFPKFIKWDDDGEYSTFIVAKAKNYYCVDMKGKVTKKGSAFKSSKMETAIKEFQQAVLDAIVAGERDLVPVYNKYVLEIFEITDIKRWSSRKTMTEKVLNSKRKNETTIKDAAAGRYVVGDKFWVYYDSVGVLRDVADYNGDHDTKKLLGKLFAGSKIFKTFLDTSGMLNYTLKKNGDALKLLRGLPIEKKEPKPRKPRKTKGFLHCDDK